MNMLRQAAVMALEALEYGQHTLKQVSENQWESRGQLAVQALRTALAEKAMHSDIIRMALEAGFGCDTDGHIFTDNHDGVCDEYLERFAALVAAAEREACAGLAERRLPDDDNADRLNAALKEIYEIWAGSEGIPLPKTAPEAYLLGLVEQMRDIARDALASASTKPKYLSWQHAKWCASFGIPDDPNAKRPDCDCFMQRMEKIPVDRSVVQQALHVAMAAEHPVKLIAALRAALAAPVQEPCTYKCETWPECECAKPWQSAPPQRPAEPVQEPDSPERRCGGPGCDMTCCQPVQEPVAVTVEAVAEVIEKDGEPELCWLIEGGIYALAEGDILMIAHRSITGDDGSGEVYTTPPQRKPLTEEEIDSIWDSEKVFPDIYAIARAVERAHGIT